MTEAEIDIIERAIKQWITAEHAHFTSEPHAANMSLEALGGLTKFVACLRRNTVNLNSHIFRIRTLTAASESATKPGETK